MEEKCEIKAYEQKEDGCLVTFGNGEQLFFSYDEFYKYSLFDIENGLSRSFESLMDSVYEDRAFSQGLREALKSRKTSGEIRKAIAKEIPEEPRERAIERLSEEQYIDDKRYAVSFVRKCAEEKLYALNMIRLQGKIKGLPEEAVEYAIEYLETDDRQTAQKALKKREKEEKQKKKELQTDKKENFNSKKEAMKKAQKLASYLGSKGFDFELIKELVNTENISEGDDYD